jgi:ABC-type glycerol-3-phosphate transport system substrate-binding protein
MQRKILPLIVLVLFALLVLTGCGGTATDEGPAPTTESVEPAQVEQITLSLWGFEGESEMFDLLIAAFEEKYPNINVEVTDIPESEYTTKIETALVAGAPPDIGFIYEPKWIAAGHFLELDGIQEEYGINLEDYNAGAMDVNCILDNRLYCFGTYTGAIMLFYNKDIFDAAGVEYPSATVPMTMEEYVTMARQLTKKGITLDDSIWGADADIGIWWQDWRNFIGEEGRKIDGYVNDEATVNAFNKLAELRADGSVISGSDAASLEGIDLLATGQLATSIVDNVIAIPMLEKAGIRWGSALVPVEKAGDEPWTTTWTDGYGVFSKSKHPDAAVKFVAFMAQEGNQIRLENGDIPLNMTLTDEWAGENEGRQEAVMVLEAARPNIFVPGYWDVTGPLWDAFYGDMLEDGRTAQEVLDEYAPILQETLDQAWVTYESFK